jgi:hypothetical protein
LVLEGMARLLELQQMDLVVLILYLALLHLLAVVVAAAGQKLEYRVDLVAELAEIHLLVVVQEIPLRLHPLVEMAHRQHRVKAIMVVHLLEQAVAVAVVVAVLLLPEQTV